MPYKKISLPKRPGKRDPYVIDRCGVTWTWPLCQYQQKTWRAVMKYAEVDSIDPAHRLPEVRRIKEAWTKLTRMLPSMFRFIDYEAVAVMADLDLITLFRLLKGLHKQDPQSIRFNVNRMGQNTGFKLVENRRTG